MITISIVDPLSKKCITSTGNPAAIPRVGDRVDMGYDPAPKVRDVTWQYHENSNVTVFVQL